MADAVHVAEVVEAAFGRLARLGGPWSRDSYVVVVEAVAWVSTRGPRGHVPLAYAFGAFASYAAERFGMLAPAVLERLHVSRATDFGTVVFRAAAEKLLTLGPEDRIEELRDLPDAGPAALLSAERAIAEAVLA